jgi:hypothetical protein
MNAKRLSATVAAVLAVSAIAAAGCGGSDDNDSSGLETSDLTKQEWITQADQICIEGDKDIGQQAGQFFDGKPTPAESTQFSHEAVLPSIQAQVARIRELGAPEGDEDQVEAMLDAVEEGLAKAETDSSALQEGALDEGTALVQAYGAKACGADNGS